jgi:cation diffusion facilitator family transporter
MIQRVGIREKEIKKVLLITLVLNIFVAVLKILAGKSFNYLSLTSSGLESLFDGSANIMALISISLATRPADKGHQFGHNKYESVGSFFIALLLIASSFQISSDLREHLSGNYVESEFNILAVIAILISMSVSYFVSYYESKKGKELSSSILEADAHHTMGDFIISFGVLGSIICSYFGLVWPDLAIGILVSIYLIYLAFKIIKTNLPDLLDASPAVEEELIKKIESIPNIRDVHRFRARGNQHWMQVDFHLLLEPSLSLIEAHELSHEAEDLLRELLRPYCNDIDILVHIEPYEENHTDEIIPKGDFL